MQEQSQSITEDDVKEVLREVRRFYKGQLKSSNKMYDNPDTEKKRRRNDNSEYADYSLQDFREENGGMDLLKYGERIAAKQATYGNCGEMAALAAHYCVTNASLKGKIQHIYQVLVRAPADHGFLLISDRPIPSVPENSSIGETFIHLRQGIWAIDGWMNIACRASDYSTQVPLKSAQWQAQGKVVAGHFYTDQESGAMPTCINENFGYKVLTSEFALEPVAIPNLSNAQEQPQTRQNLAGEPIRSREASPTQNAQPDPVPAARLTLRR